MQGGASTEIERQSSRAGVRHVIESGVVEPILVRDEGHLSDDVFLWKDERRREAFQHGTGEGEQSLASLQLSIEQSKRHAQGLPSDIARQMARLVRLWANVAVSEASFAHRLRYWRRADRCPSRCGS